MPTVAIVGAQWGDEGKGKVVDLLAETTDVVVRYAGGPNAGHTLVIGDEKLVFRLIPSGVLHTHTHCVLAQGMVLNLGILIEELDVLAGRGLELNERLSLSHLAHLIMPYHVLVDGLREAAADRTKIGTTKKGIGPCYEDKMGRRGLRAGDLADPERVQAVVGEALRHWTPIIEQLGGDLPSVASVVDPLQEHAERLLPLVTETSSVIDEQIRAGKRVMFEGAQGTLLDIDHGTYPFVTSSSAVAGGACTGAGVGPNQFNRIVGITKAYTTRVGAGPFPTELHDAAGKHMRDVGVEFGSVTGRPRSTGWLDAAGLRYARRVNGLTDFALTKLDVLTGLDPIRVCVGYDTADGRRNEFPIARLAGATPIYEQLPGWTEDITGCRQFGELPQTAQDYLRFIEQQTEVPISLVSVGPRRDETIVVRDLFG